MQTRTGIKEANKVGEKTAVRSIEIDEIETAIG